MASATNGYDKIKVGDEIYPLLFGFAASQEMSRRFIRGMSGNDFKVTTDLIYSGMMNHAIKMDMPFPTYNEVYDIVEHLYKQDDATEQYKRVWETFNKSEYGSEFNRKMEELKKKAENLTESDLIGMLSEDSV